jgi:NADP-dependent 3-hydroxy acid dehydrogenase YdfG
MSKSVAIVTGASSGIGRATAIRLAGDFAAVVLAARGAAALAEVATEVRAAGCRADGLSGFSRRAVDDRYSASMAAR